VVLKNGLSHFRDSQRDFFRICWGAEILCSREPDSDPKIMLDLDRKRAHTYIYINFRSGAKSGSASNIIFGSESDSA
jgi:hypothetical protein